MPQVPLLSLGSAASAGAATLTSPDLSLTTPLGGAPNSLTVVLVVSALAGTTPTLLLEIDGKDSVSNSYFQLHANFTTQAAPGTYVYQIAAGFVKPATGGITDGAATVPTPVIRVKVTGGGTITSAAYTVSAAWN